MRRVGEVVHASNPHAGLKIAGATVDARADKASVEAQGNAVTGV
jgi:hypothetical protein